MNEKERVTERKKQRQRQREEELKRDGEEGCT